MSKNNMNFAELAKACGIWTNSKVDKRTSIVFFFLGPLELVVRFNIDNLLE
jgi:hypothetical protein